MRKKTVYKDIEEAYNALSPKMFNFAKGILLQPDLHIDAVHEAFVKVIEWKKKTPGGIIQPRIVYKQVIRVCRKMNRRNRTVSTDDPALAAYFRTNHPEL